MESNLTILQDHYVDTITLYSTLPRNHTALQVAFHWAKKRYGGRLSTNTATAVESLLSFNPAAISNIVIPPHDTDPVTGAEQFAGSRPTVEALKTTGADLDLNSHDQFPFLVYI